MRKKASPYFANLCNIHPDKENGEWTKARLYIYTYTLTGQWKETVMAQKSRNTIFVKLLILLNGKISAKYVDLFCCKYSKNSWILTSLWFVSCLPI